jgi:hypothetical protein
MGEIFDKSHSMQINVYVNESGRSLINTRKSKGYSTVPWGTPESTAQVD